MHNVKPGPREHPIHDLYLPVRVERAFLHYGYRTIEDLMARDPYYNVTPIGPDYFWIEEVPHENPRYEGHVHYYRRELPLPNPSTGFRWMLDPWCDVRNIGIASIMITLEAIALWQQDNAFIQAGRKLPDVG